MSAPKEITQINIKSLNEKFTPAEILWKYLSYLPFFVVSLVITFIIGTYIIRYTQPVYRVSTRIFIKSSADNKIGGSSSGGGGDLIENSLFSSKRGVNLDNEIALITTVPLILKIVRDNHFNYYYYNEGNIRRSEIYKAAPFEVIDSTWADSSSGCGFYVKNLDNNGGEIQFSGEGQDKIQYQFHWGQWLNLRGNRFKVILRNPTGANHFRNKKSNEPSYYFAYQPPAATASEIRGSLMVSPYNAKTTIIKLDLKGYNLAKCADILNALAAEYDWQSIEDKSTQLTRTIEFINQRLDLVTGELGSVETDLKDFKNKNQVIDLSSQAGAAMSEKAGLEEEVTAFGIQEQLFQMIDQQVRQMPVNQLQIIPNIGLEGSPLTAVFNAYNDLVLKKLKEEPRLGENGPILTDLNAQLQIAYKAVLQALSEYKHTLDVKKNALIEKSRKFYGLINRIPGQEKTYMEIKRQQNVKEGLFLYLLQKREDQP